MRSRRTKLRRKSLLALGVVVVAITLGVGAPAFQSQSYKGAAVDADPLAASSPHATMPSPAADPTDTPTPRRLPAARPSPSEAAGNGEAPADEAPLHEGEETRVHHDRDGREQASDHDAQAEQKPVIRLFDLGSVFAEPQVDELVREVGTLVDGHVSHASGQVFVRAKPKEMSLVTRYIDLYVQNSPPVLDNLRTRGTQLLEQAENEIQAENWASAEQHLRSFGILMNRNRRAKDHVEDLLVYAEHLEEQLALLRDADGRVDNDSNDNFPE